MEFVLSATGNDNFVFEQTLLFMRTKYRSEKTHKPYLNSNLTIVK